MKINNSSIFKLDDKRRFKPNIVLIILLSFAFLFIGIIVGNIPMIIFQYMGIFKSTPLWNVFSLVIGLLPIPLVIMLFTKYVEKTSLESLGFRKDNILKRFLSGYGFGIVLFTLILLTATILGGYEVKFTLTKTWFLTFPLFMIGFIVQGSSEEILLRGWMMTRIGARYNVFLAIIVNSLIFTLLHGLNPGISLLAIINLFLFGLFASLYAIYKQDIWGICGWHASWNLFQGNFFGILVSGQKISGGSFFEFTPVGHELITGGNFGLEGSIICTLGLILGCVYLVFKYGDVKK